MNITPEKIVKAIQESKFARDCVDKDYAFDIVVEGIKLEIRPYRWRYCDDGALAHLNQRVDWWREFEDFRFEIG